MRNLEVKARCDDLDARAQRLLAMGASDHGSTREVDTYFRAASGLLKLREVAGESGRLIRYHRENRAESRFSEYEVVPVAEEHTARLHAVLEDVLGTHVQVMKRRRLLVYRHTRVHLDEVEELGRFIELETVMLGDLPEDEAWMEHMELRRALGVDEASAVAEGYAELLLAGA